jgi:hypothetical protein
MSTNPFGDNPYQAPQQSNYSAAPPAEEGDATGGVIPYKNPQALIAYYLGLFSLFPLIGFFLGIAAFVLGILGLRARAKNPAIKGSIHAWIGIIMGGMMTLVWAGCFLTIIVAMVRG